MECQRRRRWFSSAWLLILEVFALRQTQAAHHKYVGQFTAVDTPYSLLEVSGINFIDDVELVSYNNVQQQIIVKIPWASKVLGVNYFTEMRDLLVDHEQYLHWMMHHLAKNGTNDNMPPEVTVAHHVNPKGSTILSCTATSFYPQSILLHWEKNGKLGVWGKETSSGILPNMDNTFYLQVTLELPPEDSGMGYTCVVEHIELKNPAVYSVPEKPTMQKPSTLTLGIILAVILLLSCAGAFIAWKKMKEGSTGQLQGSFPSTASPTLPPQ